MSYVVLVLLLVSVLAGTGGLAAMVVKKEPFYGAAGLFVICCPTSVLALTYVALA